MKSNPVGWFEIYVRDVARARSFYEAVLAVTLSELPGGSADLDSMWAFPMVQNGPGAAGALVTMKGQQPTGNGTIVYFSCEDCAVEAQRAPSGGGRVIKDKFAIGEYGFVALVADPEGNVIGLHSRT